MSRKMSTTNKIVKGLEYIGRFPVKVADSCPLAIEQQQQRAAKNNIMETEAVRLQKMKRQAFMDKISRELKEKEKNKHIKKKEDIQQSTLNVDDYMKIDPDAEIGQGKKKNS